MKRQNTTTPAPRLAGAYFPKSGRDVPHYTEDSEMQNLTDAAAKNTNSGIMKQARARQRELAEAGELIIEHNLMKKAAADPRSKAKAIAAFCFHCMGGTIDQLPDGGWKELIRTCTAPGCPLYRHRPYRER